MNEKDIYATMARIKLKAIMAEPNQKPHGDCHCDACIVEKIKDHPANCKCNGCWMFGEAHPAPDAEKAGSNDKG